MSTISILGFMVLIITLEAITDGANYLAWTSKLGKILGPLYHGTQILLFVVIFIFGHLYTYDLWNIQTLHLIWAFALLHFGFFDLFYAWITKSDPVGSTSLWDRGIKSLLNSKHALLVAFGAVLENPFIRLIVALYGCLVLAINF